MCHPEERSRACPEEKSDVRARISTYLLYRSFDRSAAIVNSAAPKPKFLRLRMTQKVGCSVDFRGRVALDDLGAFLVHG